ncbi:MAG: hypothetical protein MHPSP_003633, partial [Paramarteilia canceri]
DDLVSELDKKIKEEETETRKEANRKTVNFYGHDPVDFNKLFNSSQNYDVKIKILETLEATLENEQRPMFYIDNGNDIKKSHDNYFVYAIFDYRILINNTIESLTGSANTEEDFEKVKKCLEILEQIGDFLVFRIK